MWRELLEKRHLAMVLFYTKGSDLDFEPVGFEESQEERIFFPDNETWKVSTQTGQPFGTGFHK